jgi:hypothetical protein
LDDQTYVQSLYLHAGRDLPLKPKLEWRFDLLNLGLVDWKEQLFIPMLLGPN